MKKIVRFFVLLVLVGVLAVGGFLIYALRGTPDISEVDVTPSGFRTVILDREGKQIRILAGSEANRVYATLDQMPQQLQQAFVAIEDERFYKHIGIDPRGIARAFVVGVKNGGFSEGASTITQQLIKNNVLTTWTEEKTFTDKVKRKVQEQFLAICLERKYDKAYILENYLNTINLGSGCWGVQAASMRYFNKDVSDLTLSECAVLAAITKNPSGYSPLNYPKDCRKRQILVLDRMLDQGYIDKATYKKAKKDKVFARIAENENNQELNGIFSYYEDAMLEQLVDDLSLKLAISEDDAWQMIYRGGLTICSSMDSNLQSILENEINDLDNYDSQEYFGEENDAEKGQGIQASGVIMDYSTGEVMAIVGGRGQKKASLIFNRATDSARQPGSTIKIPGEYALGLEEGEITLGTVFDDAYYTYSDGTEVNNADHLFKGMTTIQDAIIESRNVSAVKLARDLGIQNVYDLLKDFGFDNLTKDDCIEALALGGTYNGVTNLELTSAFGTIANGGLANSTKYYTMVYDQDQKVILDVYDLDTNDDGNRIVSYETAAQLTSAMELVLTEGTGTDAWFDGCAIAGKSGTTNDFKDIWFVGYSPYYVCGIWTGYDDYTSQNSSYSSKKIWREVMEQANENLGNAAFDMENSLTSVKICTKCGLLAEEGLCEVTDQGDMTDYVAYVYGSAPTTYCDCHEKVEICTESGKRTNNHCPENTRETHIYLKSASAGTQDEAYVIPAELIENGDGTGAGPGADANAGKDTTCDVHKGILDNILNPGNKDDNNSIWPWWPFGRDENDPDANPDNNDGDNSDGNEDGNGSNDNNNGDNWNNGDWNNGGDSNNGDWSNGGDWNNGDWNNGSDGNNNWNNWNNNGSNEDGNHDSNSWPWWPFGG